MPVPLGRHPVIIQQASEPILAQVAYTSSLLWTTIHNHEQHTVKVIPKPMKREILDP